MSEKFESIPEVPINEELIRALEEAGASGLLIEMVQVDPDDVDVERNSVRAEIQKYCYWADEISAEVIEEKKHYGGGFFQAVWNGSLEDAKWRADGNNQQILQSLGYAIPA